MRYKLEKTRAEELVQRIAEKLRKSEFNMKSIIFKKKYPKKYYYQLALTLTDYLLTQIPPSELAEFNKLRSKI